MLNDVFTAANGIYVKKKLDSKELGTFGLMYYNCVYCFPVAAFIVYQEGRLTEVLEFEYWASPTFMALYVVAQGTAPCNECLFNLRLLSSDCNRGLCSAYCSLLVSPIVRIALCYDGVLECHAIMYLTACPDIATATAIPVAMHTGPVSNAGLAVRRSLGLY